MVKRPIKTVDDIKKLMEEKRELAEKRRMDQMASEDAEPNGLSAAEALKAHINHETPKLNGNNVSTASSSSSQTKKSKKKKNKKNKNKANSGYDGTQDAPVEEDITEIPQSNGNMLSAADTPSSSKKKQKNKKNNEKSFIEDEIDVDENESPKTPQLNGINGKKKHGDKKKPKTPIHNGTTPNGKTHSPQKHFVDDEEDKMNTTADEEPEAATTPAPKTSSRKRKAAQRAAESLAIVPISQRRDDSDPEDQDYVVESPDEDGNPKRARLENDNNDSDDEDWSRQTLEQRIADMLGGGAFYDDDSGESEGSSGSSDDGGNYVSQLPLILHSGSSDDEDDTEVEVSDSDDEAGRIDIDSHEEDGSSHAEDSDEEDAEDSEDDHEAFSDDEFDESGLFGSDSLDDDEEIMSYDEDRPPNSDDEIDDVISTIRPKEDEMGLLDDLYEAGYGSTDDSEESGPVDDLDELAEHDEDDLHAEDSDDAIEDLGGFIAADGSDDSEEDESEEEGHDDDDDDDGDLNIDLGDDEYTDISPMYQMTTDYDFNIDGYRTVKNNAMMLKLERTTGAKSHEGVFTTFKFGQIPDTHSVQIAMDAFNWMVAPIEKEIFFNHLFQKRVVYIHRRDKNYYKGLFSSDDLLKMVQENDLEYGTNINIAHYDREGGRTTHNPIGRVFAHQLKAFVNADMSIQCINPQSFNDEIWYLCEILQELTNSFVGANTYLTPANSAGFAPHWDEVDAFVLQLEGKKYWRVWAPADGDEALPDESSRNFTEKEMADKNLVFEGTLQEGDMLYIPRGFYHSASTGGKEHSLHVTISLCHNVTFTHMMKGVSVDVWNALRQSRLTARRSLPPGYLEMGGVAPLDYEEGLNEHIMPVVNSMLEDIVETYRDGMASAIDKMAFEYYKTALPPLLTPEERKYSIHGGDGLSMFNEPEVKVTRMKEIRFIRQHAQRLVYENEDAPFLIHRMANSRILSENAEQKIINLEAKMVDGITSLFNEYPQWIKVKDLGCGKKVNIELAEILYNNGLIMIRDKNVA